MSTYVLVHGAWHTGAEFEPVAAIIRKSGHVVHTPTIRGNRPGDSKNSGLAEAIQSIVDYLAEHDLKDIVLVGHSYGGMVIIRRCRRSRESHPPAGLLERVRAEQWRVPQRHGAAALCRPVRRHPCRARRRFGGAAVPGLARGLHQRRRSRDSRSAPTTSSIRTRSRPSRTRSRSRTNPADMPIAKSYVNCTEDTAMPHGLPWHPRLSQKLGLFRLVQVPGSHEAVLLQSERLAQAFLEAGRDYGHPWRWYPTPPPCNPAPSRGSAHRRPRPAA